MMTTINEETIFSVIIKGSLALLMVLAIAGFALFSAQTGRGILAGGCIAIVNFIWLRSVIQRILGLLPARPNMYAQMRFIVRISVTGLLLYFLITSGWFSLAGLLVGLSIIIINIIALSLYCALRTGG